MMLGMGRVGILCALLLTISGSPASSAYVQPGASEGRFFPATGYFVGSNFYAYWQQHGGLQQQGYPISGELQERSETDGKVYTVQYFERSVFERHPENQPPYDVQLSLLGVAAFRAKYSTGTPAQVPNQSPDSVYFPETGMRLGGSFLQYWQSFGGLSQNGYPISNELQEVSKLDGKPYTVQYFERAVMEWHPGNTPPYDVLLSQLGTFRYRGRYLAGKPVPAGARLLVPGLQRATQPIVVGRSIYYLKGSADYSLVYGYDLERNREFLVSDRPGLKRNLAGDGHFLAWVERQDSRSSIQVHDLESNKTFALIEGIQLSTYPEDRALALHEGVAYYHESTPTHQGLYAHNVATGDTVLIDKFGRGPVAEDGILVWTHMEPLEDSVVEIYASAVDGSMGATFIVQASSPPLFRGYSVSERRVAYNNEMLNDAHIHVYDIATGSDEAIPEARFTSIPVIKGNVLAWSDDLRGPCVVRCGPRANDRRLRYYSLDAKQVHTVIDYTNYEPSALAVLEGPALLFSMLDAPGSNTRSVFLLDIAGPK